MARKPIDIVLRERSLAVLDEGANASGSEWRIEINEITFAKVPQRGSEIASKELCFFQEV